MLRPRRRGGSLRKKFREATERRTRAAAPKAEEIPTAIPVRSGAAPQAPSRPPADRSPVGAINCVCGQAIQITRRDDKKEIFCGKCERTIKIGIVEDAAAGTVEIVPIYSADPAAAGVLEAAPASDSSPDALDAMVLPSKPVLYPPAAEPPLPVAEVVEVPPSEPVKLAEEVPVLEEPLEPLPLENPAPVEATPSSPPAPLPVEAEETAPVIEDALPALPVEDPAPVEATPSSPPAAKEPEPVLKGSPASPAAIPKPAPLAASSTPPAALNFKCVCGRGMVAKRKDYGKRLRCHRCGVWLQIEPALDEGTKLWAVRATAAEGGEPVEEAQAPEPSKEEPTVEEKKSYSEDEIKAAREKLCLNEAQLKELRAFLSGSTFGVNITCDHTHARTEEWAGRMGVDMEEVVESVKRFGGACDCKITENVTPDKFGWS